MSGKLYEEIKCNMNIVRLDLSALEAGVYCIQVNDLIGQAKRIIKN